MHLSLKNTFFHPRTIYKHEAHSDEVCNTVNVQISTSTASTVAKGRLSPTAAKKKMSKLTLSSKDLLTEVLCGSDGGAHHVIR